MNTPAYITRITSDQVDLVAPLFDAYRQFYNQKPDAEGAREFLLGRLVNDDSVILAAIDNDQALGFTQLYPSFSSVSMRPILILNDLFVAKEARGQGIATQLMNAAVEYAKDTGAARLALSTGVENTTAQRLYERLGWHKITGFFNYEMELKKA